VARYDAVVEVYDDRDRPAEFPDRGRDLVNLLGRMRWRPRSSVWPKLPVIVARGWSESQKRAYVIADNKLALNAGWDADLLKVELEGLQELGSLR
jgi:hypothetical protein